MGRVPAAALVCAWLAAGARAQEPPPGPPEPAAEQAAPAPESSAGAEVSASTAPATEVQASTGAATAPGGAEKPHRPVAVPLEEGLSGGLPSEPPPPISRPIRVKVSRKAGTWEPVSLSTGGVPEELSTHFVRRLVTVRKGKEKIERGEDSKASASARVYEEEGDRIVVVSVYPRSLRADRTHLEARFRIVEGWLEAAQVAAVTVEDEAYAGWGREDSRQLRRRGLPFREEYPSSGSIELAAVNPRPGGSSANAGRVEHANFGGRQLGFVNFSWFVRGVLAEGQRPAPRRKARRAR